MDGTGANAQFQSWRATVCIQNDDIIERSRYIQRVACIQCVVEAACGTAQSHSADARRQSVNADDRRGACGAQVARHIGVT